MWHSSDLGTTFTEVVLLSHQVGNMNQEFLLAPGQDGLLNGQALSLNKVLKEICAQFNTVTS